MIIIAYVVRSAVPIETTVSAPVVARTGIIVQRTPSGVNFITSNNIFIETSLTDVIRSIKGWAFSCNASIAKPMITANTRIDSISPFTNEANGFDGIRLVIVSSMFDTLFTSTSAFSSWSFAFLPIPNV